LEKYNVHLNNFEGPLDLLMHLIDVNQMDIYDIPIAEVTVQYLAFLEEAREMDLEVASEFLVMAATLISIKAKMLLPKDKQVQEEEDPREELVNKLLEYKFYKNMAEVLKENAVTAGEQSFREIDVEELAKSFTPDNPVENISLNDLWQAFSKVLLHIKEEPPVLIVDKESYDVEEMMEALVHKLEKEGAMSFEGLFAPSDSKRKVISVFLAVLELYKVGALLIKQEENFGQLWLALREKGEQDAV